MGTQYKIKIVKEHNRGNVTNNITWAEGIYTPSDVDIINLKTVSGITSKLRIGELDKILVIGDGYDGEYMPVYWTTNVLKVAPDESETASYDILTTDRWALIAEEV